jgi:hypothetical protein
LRPGLAALVLVLLTAAAKPSPAPYVDAERGFQVALPAGWQRVVQTTAAGAREPVLKASNDAASQWLVVLVERGPTDEAADAALEHLESGFRSAAGYKRLSLRKKTLATGVKKNTLPAIDLWFVMQRDGKPVTVGVRAILYPSYVLTLVVDAPGRKSPDRSTRRLVESFRPAPPELREPAAPVVEPPR